jgi:SAM-dependent methyltransferase
MADPTTSSVEPAAKADEALDYGAYYYRHDCGIPYERNEHWLNFFGEIAERIFNTLHPTSVLDAGCAMGFLVEALHDRGVDAWGIDVSEFAISKAHESIADRCRVASLVEPLERRFDLITCIEVLEHIPPEETDRVIANLCQATDTLLLSTSPLDFSEATHLNVQPPEFWAAALAREGFLRDLDQDVSYLTPWAAVYRRQEEPLFETVRRYDRALWRQRHEAHEVRRSLLKAHEQIAELEQAEDEEEERPELLAEIDRRDEEILRLRDLLIGRDAELGFARGRLAALEEQTQRIAAAADRIQSKIPGLRFFSAIYRRLRALLGA